MLAGLQLTFIAVLIIASAPLEAAEDASLYREGIKQFQGGDYAAAGRALSQLAPFTQEFGEQARYLLARVHDLSGERPEALALYEAIIDYHTRCRAEAANALSRPESLKDQPAEKARLEKLLKDRTPDHVIRSRFYAGRLLVEEGRYEDALARLARAQQDADGALGEEIKLWLGVAEVQTKRFDEAIKNLATLNDAEALRWLARAQVGQGVTPIQLRQNGAGILPNQEERKAAFASAIASLKKAVALGGKDDLKLELADLLRVDGQYEAAAASYADVSGELKEKGRYRWAVALQLAGKFDDADAAIEKFTADYPRSVLLADAAVRYAENALLARRFDEAMKRFEAVGKRYANTEQAYLATMGIAFARYQSGHFDEAVKIASSIPDGERLGDLAAANYLIADCQLRNLPKDDGDDALATARLIQDLSDLGDRFKSFMLAHEAEPQSVDAALKLGYCLGRQASLIADPAERRKPLSAARRMYMGLLRQFPDHPLYPVMVLESARCTTLFGSRMAENELARFQFEPLKSSPLAAPALVRLGQVMRNSRRSEAAAKMLAAVRAEHEAALMKDRSKITWAAALRFELGMALKDSGQYEQAQEVLQSFLKDFPRQPQAAEIGWRIAQCQREAAMEQLLPVRRLFGRRDSAEQTRSTLAAPLQELRQVGTMMLAEAKQKKDEPDLAAQIAYEAGGCWRTVAEYEAEAARAAAQEEAQRMKQRLKQRLAAPATKPATQPAAETGHDSVKEARACYQAILEFSPDSPAASDAKNALAELDQARPLQIAKRRASSIVLPARYSLPLVLNLDGSAEFARLEPVLRSNSSDLTDESSGSLDEALLSRPFSLSEEAVITSAGK